MTRVATLFLVAAFMLVAGGCEREKRGFGKPSISPDPRAQAEGIADLQPGEPGRGMRAIASAAGYNESSAYQVAQGKRLYRWYNCSGCHAQGGGAIGPALMDDKWIYGKDADTIFATIMEGRPNGMPSFRGRVPEEQAWQLVAYVRSMSGLLPSNVAPNRSDAMAGAPPEGLRKAQRPDDQ
jgi:cytochrome c oxidase cbb3-type subunit 3